MNIFKKLALKLKLIKPKQNWFKKFFKSFKSLFGLKSRKSRFFVGLFVVLALGASFFIVYSQNSNNSDGEVSLSKGLVAHWTMDEEDYEEGTINLITNASGKNISNGIPGNFKPGWDESLHGDAITVNSWASGYNSGVSSQNIGYHAKWVYEGIDGENDPCIKFIDRNDEYGLGHRWLGVSQSLGTPASLGLSMGDTLTVSWWQKSDVLNKGARVGLYHHILSTGSYSFNSSISYAPISSTNKWERVSFSVTIDNDWDLNKNFMVYVYGHNGGYGTLWVDNVQLEKKDHATPFVDGERVDRFVDKSAYSNHGINSGATFTEDRFGKEGGAMSFNGDGSHILINNGFTQGGDSFSVSAWVKRQSGSSYYPIFNFGSSPSHGLSLHGSLNRLQGGDGSGNSFDRSSFGSGLTFDSWNQIVVTYDGASFKKYENGNHVASFDWPHGIGNPASFKIGDFWGPSFKGSIDDVRIYNRALSSAEINSLYDTYNPKTTTGTLQQGLVLDMPLKLKYTKDETPGSEIMTDRTPYSNDGQNYGATITEEGAYFNGAGNRINIDGVTVGDSFSMGSWAKVNNPNNSTSGLGGIISNHVHTGPTYGATLYVRNLNSLVVAGGDGNGDRTAKAFYPDVNFEEWNHFFTTYENGEFKVYVNGDLIGNFIKNVVQNNTPWRIGQWASSYGSYYYHGVLSGAKVYNRALSEEEVKTLYDRGRSDAGIIFQEN